ncbi:TrkH family potassium uptake protein [Mycoplasma sp. P36-A1]|uniref:TrkH family potassium uptake protein n=1 Tax=Mycoplasma sp. P36-A1 TaxID=3252900 RepID=UPI003C2BC5CB
MKNNSTITRMKNENKGLGFKKRISLLYLAIIALGTLILYLPISTGQQDISFIDALFVSASAFSDTGLSPVPTATTFNMLGQITILILVYLGGIGIMSVKSIIFVIIGRKITSSDRKMISTEQGQGNKSGMVKMIKLSVQTILFFQLLFTLIMGLHMIIFYDYSILDGLWFGLFHSITSINNAGFDLTGNSMVMFQEDYLFQIYIMILIVIGGLGFPILVDINNYVQIKIYNMNKENKKKKRFRFTVFSKLSFATYVIITIVGFILLLVFDYDFFVMDNPGLKGIFLNLFQVISARNAGFATFDLTDIGSASQLVLAALMFIGAAPASTGGGIRTTTFALIFLYILNFANNRDYVEVFSRRIKTESIYSAFVTMTIASLLCCVSAIVIVGSNQNYLLTPVIFEIASAFGTTGLTLNFTPELNLVSKLCITMCMIIGQMGITNAVILFARQTSGVDLVKSPEEDVLVG